MVRGVGVDPGDQREPFGRAEVDLSLVQIVFEEHDHQRAAVRAELFGPGDLGAGEPVRAGNQDAAGLLIGGQNAEHGAERLQQSVVGPGGGEVEAAFGITVADPNPEVQLGDPFVPRT